MKFYSTICCVLLLLSVTCKGQKNTTNSPQQLTGLWILDKYESYDTLSNKWTAEHGRMGYTGYVLFDGLGHMAIQITPADYNEFTLNKRDSVGMKIVLDLSLIHI